MTSPTRSVGGNGRAGREAPSTRAFRSKDAARRFVWDALERERVARFPYPPHERIPNFDGARQAAERLAGLDLFRAARCIKVNPDAPQRHVRRIALERGITVFMPTPRLKGGFLRLDPDRIPRGRIADASSLSKSVRWAERIPVLELPEVDLIVTGSVAVTRDGLRCGKGHGYGDLEYAILRELGHPPVPVATTVHPLQIVGSFPAARHDLPVSVIVTAGGAIVVDDPPAPPGGIDWEALPDEALESMPVLRELAPRRNTRG